jgi:hypothetical protein
MAIGLSDILSALQNGVTAIQGLQRQLATSFPPITAPSTHTPAVGTITYSSSLVAAFGLVTTSSGATYRIALLPSS